MSGYDLVVVGAGPAGSSAAYQAAVGGLEVALLDRKEFPRDKACGDGLLPHAANELRRMGLIDWLEDPAHSRFTGYSIHTGYGEGFVEDAPASPWGKTGYVIERSETDEAILSRARWAGADFYPGANARELVRSPGGNVRGVEAILEGEREEFRAPLVVVADGVGAFAGGGGIKKAKPGAVAIRQYLAGAGGSNSECVHFWVTPELLQWGPAYGWLFYLGDGRVNAGVAIYTSALSRSPHTLSELYDRFLQETDVAERLEGAQAEAPPKSWSLKTGMAGERHSQGLMAAGDAASMIHPLSGEGVGYALESGRFAGWWAIYAHNEGDFSASLLSGYARRIRRARAGDHPPGAALIAGAERFPQAHFLERIFDRAMEDKSFRTTLMSAFSGNAPVYSVLSRHPLACARVGAGVTGGALATSVRNRLSNTESGV